MKLFAPLFCFPLLLVPVLYGQGVINTATINSTVTITNPAGAVKNRLLAAGGPQLRSHYVTAVSNEVSPRVATASQVPTSTTGSTLPLPVDAVGSPSYRVTQRVDFEVWFEQFYWPQSGLIPVVPAGTSATGVSGMVSIVDFQFGAAVAGGSIRAYPAGMPGATLAVVGSLPAGVTHCEFVVPVGVPLVLELGIDIGSGGRLGSVRRLARTVTTWNAGAGVPADQIFTVPVNVADASSIGSVKGVFDVTGETEALLSTAPGDTFNGGYSGVNAIFASGLGANWTRRALIGGAPSSGQFVLSNLTSSASAAVNDPGSFYALQGEAWLQRTLPSGTKAAQFFRTGEYRPAPAINVPGGGTGNEGDALVIAPGDVRGTWTLQGPPTEAGRPPLLGSIRTDADGDTNNDGLPDAAGFTNPDNWLARSAISMSGTTGAALNAFAAQLLERQWTEPNVTAEYQLALGGTGSATSTWTAPALHFQSTSASSASADVYFNTDYTLRAAGAADVIVTAGASQTQNFSIGMGELCLTVRRAAGSTTLLFQPEIRYFENGLTGAPGNEWTVENIRAFGFPTTDAAAAASATLRTVLPAGTYTIRPVVGTKSAGGALGAVSMLPFTVTIPARGRVCVDNGVAVAATIPACIGAAGRFVNGAVNSDGSPVTAITFTVDGGAPAAATFVPGVDPAYSFTIPAGLAPGNHIITITVTTADGRTASFSQQVRVDNVPPVITCPANMEIYADYLTPPVVNYPSPVFSDDCGAVSVICSPPSGSVFPFGTTSVLCTAQDAAGNTAGCFFSITVHRPCPPPVRSHRYSAASGTYFRYTDVNDWHDSTAMTITAWVKRESTGACETIIAQNYQQSFWFGFCSPAGNLRFYRSGGASADSTGTVPAGQWTHVTVIYDGFFVAFYLDGAPAGLQPLANSGPGTSDPITIGGDFTEGSYNYGFTGLLDEIKIYGRVLGALEIPQSAMNQQTRTGLDLEATFGAGGSVEDLLSIAPASVSAIRPMPEIEGILPRYMVVPRVTGHAPGVDGEVNTGFEYATADKMVIRYRDGANGIQDAVAYFKYQDDPGDRALYIGVKNVRNVIAPWTRAQSWVAVQVDENPETTGPPPFAGATDFRFNSRRLDGSIGVVPPTGFERGDGAGNYGPLPPGDPLNFAPAPFGLIGAGGDTVEFRFDLSTLGGDWRKELRIGLSHHWISGMGVDANGPIGAAFDRPWSWADVSFSGQLPELHHAKTGDTMYFEWLDPDCHYVLECSPTMEPFSWAPILAPRFLNHRDDILRAATFDTNLHRRKFFRLRR